MAQSIVDSSRPALTHRERFRRQMHYQSIDRGVHWEFNYLRETLDRWHSEGLPAEITAGAGPESVEAYFGVDPSCDVPVMLGLYPDFNGIPKVIEKKEHSEILEYPNGMICEAKTDGNKTIPHYLKFPIANREDWKRFKERLDPASPERHKVDWKKIGEELRRVDVPVGISLGSYFGVPRNWIGFEQIALLLYDDRELIEEIVETLTKVVYSQLEIALKEVQPDFAAGWEDICFRNGPIISPQMFSEIVIPRLKRVTTLLRQHGCDVIWTDCDGDIRKLVPLWLDAGVNCMFPLEVHPGSDPVWLRKEYGKRILLRGGLAKYEFAKGRKEILAELKRVEKVFEEGGYIPHGDHFIPDDVPYDNYKYYIREKLAMLGWKQGEVNGLWPLLSGTPPFSEKWMVSGIQTIALKDATCLDPADKRLRWCETDCCKEGHMKGFVDARGGIAGRAGVVYLVADRDAGAAECGNLNLGYDGPIAVWMNGKKIFAGPGDNPATPDKTKVAVELKQGKNRLTIALDTNKGQAWGIFARY